MTFIDDPHPFIPARPEWTLSGVILTCGESDDLSVDQTPFRWVEGVWETETVVTNPHHPSNEPTRVILRISPETMRRWRDAGINPFLEACAQLEEHLRMSARHSHLTALTLL